MTCVVAVVHGGALAEVLRAESIPVLAVPSGATPSIEDMLALLNESAGLCEDPLARA